MGKLNKVKEQQTINNQLVVRLKTANLHTTVFLKQSVPLTQVTTADSSNINNNTVSRDSANFFVGEKRNFEKTETKIFSVYTDKFSTVDKISLHRP
jgi:hypothetical protein